MPGFISGVEVCVASACRVGVAEGGNQITVAVGGAVSVGEGVEEARVPFAGAHEANRIAIKRKMMFKFFMK